ncbi:MAG: hypothetical protein KBD39_12425 [Sterolibacterium sp.]|nr:hypothetical protein [Sterolibacterium sp.]MBP9907304.1 hypothetical protein [Rhodoferax sp.]
MAKREEKTTVGNFARGSELWTHQARLILVALRNLMLVGVVLGLLVAGAYI